MKLGGFVDRNLGPDVGQSDSSVQKSPALRVEQGWVWAHIVV